ncbi:MAG: HAMP domain-containing histidine kinase [Candidatus Eisenbacteria sp.]|nr:HAMP domain-containing histidine kinase [Candidatus Eisenbacteria bacterium]
MNPAASDDLVRRIHWLVRIRWIAAIAVAVVTLIASRILHISVAALPLYGISALLAGYNSLFLLYLRRAARRDSPATDRQIAGAANAQISIDLLVLGALIHFSGGVDNPFVLYFVFHMIIASILLSRRAAFLQALLATCVFAAVASLEYYGVLHHYCVDGVITSGRHADPLFVMGIVLVLATTLYTSVYLASSIAAELRERDDRLDEANRLLIEQDCIKSEYVFRVTHDIKGHLSAISSCLEPVLEGVTGPLRPGQLDLLRRAGRRTEVLARFVKALLELTRMRLSDEIAAERFSVGDAAKAAVSYVEARAHAKSIAVDLCVADAPTDIVGARVYIEETVANLVANAVKYSPDGSRVRVTVEGTEDAVLVEVSDSGIGIPASELPAVFDEFYRASNARAVEREGTGLGLSMAKQVVERHGGHIGIESKEGRGTTVTLALPRRPSAQGLRVQTPGGLRSPQASGDAVPRA